MKSLKVLDRPVAGGTLTVTQFPVLTAIRVGARVFKLVGPVLGAFGVGVDFNGLAEGGLGDSKIDLAKALPKVLSTLAETLNPDQFGQLCQDLLGSAIWTDGKVKYELGSNPAYIDVVFCGSITDLFQALRLVLEANDFFGFGAIGKLRQAPAVAPTTNSQAA